MPNPPMTDGPQVSPAAHEPPQVGKVPPHANGDVEVVVLDVVVDVVEVEVVGTRGMWSTWRTSGPPVYPCDTA